MSYTDLQKEICRKFHENFNASKTIHFSLKID